VSRSSLQLVNPTGGRPGRYSGPPTLILTSLASGPKHGYALTKDIEAFAGIEIGPGTLYGALVRLERDGLIEALPGDDRRRPYRITANGAQALQVHLRLQRQITTVGLRRLRTVVGWSPA
jgi:DNA-binding PadR family transcriptional regulator